MNTETIEQRARELLEAECGKPLPIEVPVCAAHSAVVAALSQQPEPKAEAPEPAGWVIATDGRAELDYPGTGLADGEHPVYPATQAKPEARGVVDEALSAGDLRCM